MATWLQSALNSVRNAKQGFVNAVGGERNANFAKAGVSALGGNIPGAIYYGVKGFNTPSKTGWGSAISNMPYDKPTTTVYDFQNQIPSLASGLFTPSIPKGDYGTTVQDVTNTFSPSMGSGLQMAQEPGAPQQAAPQQAPVAPRITPQKMPMPSDLDYIMGQLDPSGLSAYQSRAMPTYQNPMTTNNGYFDMNKAGTVGGKWIEGAGWMTDAAKAAGLKPEDVAFQAMMNQRIASMYQ
jgi:hypothetical protein